MSNEQSGTTTPLNVSFFESFAAEKRYKSGGQYINNSRVTRLLRVNYIFAHDFRVIWDSFWLHDDETPLRFASVGERDRFFVDLAKAMQEWQAKYPQFAAMQLTIDQRCSVNTNLVPCSGSESEERARDEASEKLRALLTTLPMLNGSFSVGGGRKLILRVLSFDSGTGSVSGAVDFIKDPADPALPPGGEFDLPLANPPGGNSSRAVGSVSRDTLDLTATFTMKTSQVITVRYHFTLRYNGSTRKLVGSWCVGTTACEVGDFRVASFDIK